MVDLNQDEIGTVSGGVLDPKIERLNTILPAAVVLAIGIPIIAVLVIDVIKQRSIHASLLRERTVLLQQIYLSLYPFQRA